MLPLSIPLLTPVKEAGVGGAAEFGCIDDDMDGTVMPCPLRCFIKCSQHRTKEGELRRRKKRIRRDWK